MLDDRVARAALGAVRERVFESTIGPPKNISAAIKTDSQVGEHFNGTGRSGWAASCY
jgi:hypothetical protein